MAEEVNRAMADRSAERARSAELVERLTVGVDLAAEDDLAEDSGSTTVTTPVTTPAVPFVRESPNHTVLGTATGRVSAGNSDSTPSQWARWDQTEAWSRLVGEGMVGDVLEVETSEVQHLMRLTIRRHDQSGRQMPNSLGANRQGAVGGQVGPGGSTPLETRREISRALDAAALRRYGVGAAASEPEQAGVPANNIQAVGPAPETASSPERLISLVNEAYGRRETSGQAAAVNPATPPTTNAHVLDNIASAALAAQTQPTVAQPTVDWLLSGERNELYSPGNELYSRESDTARESAARECATREYIDFVASSFDESVASWVRDTEINPAALNSTHAEARARLSELPSWNQLAKMERFLQDDGVEWAHGKIVAELRLNVFCARYAGANDRREIRIIYQLLNEIRENHGYRGVWVGVEDMCNRILSSWSPEDYDAVRLIYHIVGADILQTPAGVEAYVQMRARINADSVEELRSRRGQGAPETGELTSEDLQNISKLELFCRSSRTDKQNVVADVLLTFGVIRERGESYNPVISPWTIKVINQAERSIEYGLYPNPSRLVQGAITVPVVREIFNKFGLRVFKSRSARKEFRRRQLILRRRQLSAQASERIACPEPGEVGSQIPNTASVVPQLVVACRFETQADHAVRNLSNQPQPEPQPPEARLVATPIIHAHERELSRPVVSYYWVSYTVGTVQRWVTVEFPRPIETGDDVRQLQDDLSRNYGENAILINWKRLKRPPTPPAQRRMDEAVGDGEEV